MAPQEGSGWGLLQYICLGDLPQRTERGGPALLNACELAQEEGAGRSVQLSCLQSTSQGEEYRL